MSNIRFYITSHEHIHTLVHTCEIQRVAQKLKFVFQLSILALASIKANWGDKQQTPIRFTMKQL